MLYFKLLLLIFLSYTALSENNIQFDEDAQKELEKISYPLVPGSNFFNSA